MTLDPVAREVMGHAFAGIAEEMGLVLIHSAVSPNIRERRDASAALFDAEGDMIAQAAHIPVHLGALADAVQAVRAERPQPGELYILNDPYAGGSHLPDLTLIGVIRTADGIGGYSVVRAHHSDVGGATPGSMPAGARELFAEGLVLPPVLLTPEVERMVFANVRTPEIRRADLAAQRAAVERGAEGMWSLAARHGWAFVREAARALMDHAEARAHAVLSRLPLPSQGSVAAVDWLEGDGVSDADIAIQVAVSVKDGRLHTDFSGTAPAVPGNVNCPIAVTHAAVLFVVQTLLGEGVPMNAGVARTVQVTAPEGCLVHARWPHAVAAGNVETSQRIADTVFRALGAAGVPVPAQGQGTMNNVTLGAPGWTYYETLGGGQGAGPGGPGASGVHVGMSNTRNTPIEVLEMECPIRVRRYALRGDSGGAGRWRGGEGIVRELELLVSAEASILSERRRHPPRGSAGGGDGACGINLKNGAPLPAKANFPLAAGDILRIETPGGGGWGVEPSPTRSNA
ncbi:MAG TPA: hydantoinase B/oxoprolinase family protein [Gemmatimonadales bacterium]|nr:hydantoinase B/oxoprolinase family protein [Gemmatimonadales bacterium]